MNVAVVKQKNKVAPNLLGQGLAGGRHNSVTST